KTGIQGIQADGAPAEHRGPGQAAVRIFGVKTYAPTASRTPPLRGGMAAEWRRAARGWGLSCLFGLPGLIAATDVPSAAIAPSVTLAGKPETTPVRLRL